MPAPAPMTTAAGLTRLELNRLAAELALPLFWIEDENGNGALEADELAVLWGIASEPRSHWVKGDELTPAFATAFAAMLKQKLEGPSYDGLSADEKKRRELVLEELAQGVPTLIHSSFAGASAEDRAIVENIVAAAAIIETLYAKQRGTHQLASQLAPGDTASRSLFHRNQEPLCRGPKTEQDPQCNAVPSLPKPSSGLYPAALQAVPDFCGTLEKDPQAAALRDPFTVVTGAPGALSAVPYTEAYATEMQAVAAKLDAAAAAITSADEAAFKRYLSAAAQAFRDNQWEPADEAWAAMNVHNSKWYLRIGPDEVYFEPCNLKGGFHVSFARINKDSLAWQEKLAPVKGEMEGALAKLAGKPYAAREVSFHLPDFIDIVLNAGDSRSPRGATIGQSLPNFGKVAAESRGRTVAMTNLYTDPDSRKSLASQASSLFCADTMALFDTAPSHQVVGTVLHEAAHNLGPTGAYEVKGKKAPELFGGPLASTLEELKAQTAALYFTDWLVDKKLLGADVARKVHVRDITWAFGHIAQGMYTADGKPKPYSQLAAIQLSYLTKNGAAEWRAGEKAQNGTDVGCLSLSLDEFPKVVEALMEEVLIIKARGDKPRAEKLKAEHVDAAGPGKELLEVIRERWLRAPKATFVYSIEM